MGSECGEWVTGNRTNKDGMVEEQPSATFCDQRIFGLGLSDKLVHSARAVRVVESRSVKSWG